MQPQKLYQVSFHEGTDIWYISFFLLNQTQLIYISDKVTFKPGCDFTTTVKAPIYYRSLRQENITEHNKHQFIIMNENPLRLEILK